MLTLSRLLGATCALLLLLAAGPDTVHAQKKYAAFIHGFSFSGPNDCVKRNNGERWKKSGTPDLWRQRRLVDGYVLLKYCDADLYRKTDATLRDLTRQMKQVRGNVEWVLVGHSQGGIVARLLHEHLRTKNPEINVRGVVAMASPMQGARPSQLAYGRRSGHKNVKPVLDGFLNDVIAGPRATITHHPLARVINIATLGWSGRRLKVKISKTYVNERRKIGDRINAMNVQKRSKQNIGPNGRLIRQINAAPNPRRYRAYIGAERAQMAARLGSAGLKTNGLDLGFTPLAQFGIGTAATLAGLGDLTDMLFVIEGRKIQPGDEGASVNVFNDLRRTYRRKASKYRVRRWFGFTCVLGDCKKYRAWKRGRQALKNADRTHAKLIDSKRTVRRTGRRYKCEGNRALSVYDTDQKLLVPGSNRRCYWQTYTYYTTINEKSDGLLGIGTCTWGPNQNPDDRRVNFLYGDNGRGLGGGTGYNHAEVVYEKRRYNASTDPGVPNNAFRKGQLNPPTRDADQWIRDSVF